MRRSRSDFLQRNTQDTLFTVELCRHSWERVVGTQEVTVLHRSGSVTWWCSCHTWGVCGDAGCQWWFLGKGSYRTQASASLGQEKRFQTSHAQESLPWLEVWESLGLYLQPGRAVRRNMKEEQACAVGREEQSRWEGLRIEVPGTSTAWVTFRMSRRNLRSVPLFPSCQRLKAWGRQKGLSGEGNMQVNITLAKLTKMSSHGFGRFHRGPSFWPVVEWGLLVLPPCAAEEGEWPETRTRGEPVSGLHCDTVMVFWASHRMIPQIEKH